MKEITKKHKFLAALLILAAAGGGYYFYRASTQGQAATRYVLAQVNKGTLVVSVSGTGQAAAADQVVMMVSGLPMFLKD